MAVKVAASITLHAIVSVDSLYRYYMLKSSTADAPDKPESVPDDPQREAPDGWLITEPTFNENSTDTLYVVDLTVFSDGTYQYSSVSKSTSFEAAKLAYENALAAQETAEEAAKKATNFLEYTAEGGLILGNKTGETWSGYRSQLLPDALNILDSNGTVLASYGAETIKLGADSENAIVEMCGGLAEICYAQEDFDDEKVLKIKGENIELSGSSTSLHSQYNYPHNQYNVFVSTGANDEYVGIGLMVQHSTNATTWTNNYLEIGINGIEALASAISLESRGELTLASYATILNSTQGLILFNSLNQGLFFAADNTNPRTSRVSALHMDDDGNIGYGYGLKSSGMSSIMYGNYVSLDATSRVVLKLDGTDVLRLGAANTDGHYIFRPDTDDVTALGSTSVRFEAVNAMILRTYNTETTSSGVSARIYSNRIYRYSSSSRRYKTDIKPLSVDSLDYKKLLDIDVVQFKYKPGYLMSGDIRENTEIPGFIVEDLEKIYPVAVDYNDDGTPEMWNANILIPAMLKLIQEQNERIEELERKNYEN